MPESIEPRVPKTDCRASAQDHNANAGHDAIADNNVNYEDYTSWAAPFMA